MVYLSKFKFSKLNSSDVAHLYRFDNGKITVDITNFGAAIVSVKMPDKKGRLADVVLGFSDVEGYQNQTAYFGVVAGRYANRIAKGQFKLGTEEYKLAQNDGENHLHGGIKGFGARLWDTEIIGEKHNPKLLLSLTSEDGDEGYPGKALVRVTYYLDEENQLHIDYHATSDKDTIINLTNHSYFNLCGHNKGDILRHKLYINADKFVRINEKSIPTGEIAAVEGTPFDFRDEENPHSIGERISQQNSDLECGLGYDHSFVLPNSSEKTNSKEMLHAATLFEEYTGRSVLVYTNQPAVQLYTGNCLDKTHIGKQKYSYGKRTGVCLETQCFPDSPNHDNFPSCVLKAGESYETSTIFKFETRLDEALTEEADEASDQD